MRKKASLNPSKRLEEVLTYHISMVELLLLRRVKTIYSGQFNLTTHQWKVLAGIGVWGPTQAVEISEWVTVDKSAVSRTVRQLIDKGMVQRSPHDVDSRKWVLKLTRQGQMTFDRITAQIAIVQSCVLSGLSKFHAMQLFQALHHIEARLRNSC
jgi:putative acetyltransferase